MNSSAGRLTQLKILLLFSVTVPAFLAGCMPAASQEPGAGKSQSVSAPVTTAGGAGPCTQVPAIVKNWTKQIEDEFASKSVGMTAQAFGRYMSDSRVRASGLPNPFIRIARMTPAERSAANERVLWEDANVMVLVDRFDTGPKGLVIPKKENVWFPIDASPELMASLERVATAVSDSFILAAGRNCDPGLHSEIEVHGPQGIGVQQLHIHVRYKAGFPQTGNQDDFYLRASTALANLLK